MEVEIGNWNPSISECQTWAQIIKKLFLSCFHSRIDYPAEPILPKLYKEILYSLLPRISRLLPRKLNAAVRVLIVSLWEGRDREPGVSEGLASEGSPELHSGSGSPSVICGPLGVPKSFKGDSSGQTTFITLRCYLLFSLGWLLH